MVRVGDEGFSLDLVPERLQGETASFDIRVGDRLLLEAGQRIKAKHVRELTGAGVGSLPVPREYLVGKILAHDLRAPDTGELLALANDELTLDKLEKIQAGGVAAFQTLYINDVNRGPYLSNTLRADPTRGQWDARSKSTA